MVSRLVPAAKHPSEAPTRVVPGGASHATLTYLNCTPVEPWCKRMPTCKTDTMSTSVCNFLEKLMSSIRASALAVTIALAAIPAVAAMSPNLIANPGNEAALVGGEIPGWTEIAGSTWTQRSESPDPFEGHYYFFAGANASAVLRQTIDLGDFGTQIDAGLLGLDFSGRVRSFAQSPTDTATITLRFLDASASTLNTFTSGAIANTAQWQLVSSALVAPALARSVQVDLVSTRNGGANNDGYFDDLHLTTVSMVPEPASSALLLAGLAATVALARRRRSTRE